MRKIAIAAAAALVAVAGTSAFAKAAPQSYRATLVGKGTFVENFRTKRSDTGTICTFSKGTFVIFDLTGSQNSGLGGSKILTFKVTGADDPRTATLPITYNNDHIGADVTGTATITTVKFGRGGLSSKTTSWAVDENAVSTNPFTLTFTAYDSVTGRLRGKFGGTMIAGESNPTARKLKVKNGTFYGNTTFLGF